MLVFLKAAHFYKTVKDYKWDKTGKNLKCVCLEVMPLIMWLHMSKRRNL